MARVQAGRAEHGGWRLALAALLALATLLGAGWHPDTATATASAAGPVGARAATGLVWAWGNDNSGQLGDGTANPDNPTPTQLASIPTGITALAGGDNHTLALAADGTVWSWGNDSIGQLGDGTPSSSGCFCNATPTQIAPATLSGIVAVAAGGAHNLALKADGSVWAWGGDSQGQLGDGTIGMPPSNATPTQIAPATLSSIIAIAAGSIHSLALKVDGTVWAWGDDAFGQLGDGTVNPDNATPTQIAPATLSGIIAVAAGGTHNLALKADGTVWAWGRNSNGQLGGGVITSENATPTQIAPATLSGVVAVAAGSAHSLALKANGTVWAWGLDSSGQLGDGTADMPTSNHTPAQLAAPTGIVALAAGASHSLALAANGTVWAWGDDTDGQLGDGTAGPNKPTPAPVTGLTGIVALAAGGDHSLAIQQVSAVSAWGRDAEGQLGDGGSLPGTDQASPVPLPAPTGVVAVAGGGLHSLALTGAGRVYAWGSDFYGQLGDGGGNTNQASPVLLATPTNVVAVAAGDVHSLALTADGRVYAWGRDSLGQLGDGGSLPGTNQASPVLLATPTNVVAVAAGAAHSLALTADGRVYAWGYDFYGQLGDGGGNTDQASPVLLATPTNVVAVAAGNYHSLALTADGRVYAWGRDAEGQLGDGGSLPGTNQGSPALLPAPTNVAAVAAGGIHSLALTADGRVYAWGYDGDGQLGDGGGNTDQPSPVLLATPTNVAAVAGGGNHSLALTADGRVYAWGSDQFGQLGDGGGNADQPSPMLLATPTNVVTVAGGGLHSLALAAPTSQPTATAATNASATYGDASVTLNATVTSTDPVNGGTVTFTVKRPNTTVLGTATSGPVAAGAASASFTIPPGTPGGSYTIEAAYNGAPGFDPSADPTPATLTIAKATTSTTIGTPTSVPSCGASTVTIPVTIANTSNNAALTGGTATVTLTQGATVVGTGSAAVSGADPVTVNVVVALSGLAAGTVTVNASYNGDGNFKNSTATPTSFVIPLTATTVTVQNATAAYGDASVTLTATVASANGAALTGGTVTFVVRKGTQVVGTVTSGPVVGASPVTVSVTLPLNASYDARSYGVTATYSGNVCFATDDGTGTLTVQRKILWVKPTDRTVGLHLPNPPTDPHGDPTCPAPSYCLELTRSSGFAYGQSWSALNLSVLRFQYARNPPSTNATEHVGSTYRITAFGASSSNYDIRYDPGTLTVK